MKTRRDEVNVGDKVQYDIPHYDEIKTLTCTVVEKMESIFLVEDEEADMRFLPYDSTEWKVVV